MPAWPDALDEVLAEPGLVRPVFQPIVDLERGVACGFETLARFASALDMPPPAWIEAAYRFGKGERLEALLLDTGLDAAADLPTDCFLTVNVSPRALISQEVAAVLARRTSLARIVLEVTEQADVEDYAGLRAVIARIRAAGGSIAVDDAGAGYASLSHILALRPEFVKLDRGLVSGIDRDEAKRAVVESLKTLSGRIGAQVVAEGVERTEEAAALQLLGVPLAQGYALGRPAPAMAPIDPEVTRALRAGWPQAAVNETVARAVEPAAAALRSDGAAAVERLLADQPARHVAILDRRGRPIALFCRDGASERSPMRVEAREPIADVARRALTRPASQRFDPLVCCDAHGRYQGMVKVERLIETLAALVECRDDSE
jgi:EAL domain-containing protein (putative c-di-GMP-specific phosphodiesterase class I)